MNKGQETYFVFRKFKHRNSEIIFLQICLIISLNLGLRDTKPKEVSFLNKYKIPKILYIYIYILI